MQSAILAVTLSLSAMGCHYGSICVSGGYGGWHRHACYSSCYSGGCYGGYYGVRRMGGFAGGYSQGWSSPGYAPMSYSGGGYSASFGQMAGYSPMSSGYAMPMRNYPSYGSTTPMSYGTPGTVTYGTPGASTYSSALRQTGGGHLLECRARSDDSRKHFPGTGKRLPARHHQPGSEQHAQRRWKDVEPESSDECISARDSSGARGAEAESVPSHETAWAFTH